VHYNRPEKSRVRKVWVLKSRIGSLRRGSADAIGKLIQMQTRNLPPHSFTSAS
jgi:hypothetical protein